MAEPSFSEQSLEQNAAVADSTDVVPRLDDDPGPGPADAIGAVSPQEPADQDLRIEVTQLRRAMETRPAIDQAKGVLMAAYGLSPDEAWKILVTVSQQSNTKLHLVAGEIVSSADGSPVDGRLRRFIEAGLRELRRQ